MEGQIGQLINKHGLQHASVMQAGWGKEIDLLELNESQDCHAGGKSHQARQTKVV